MRTLTYWALFAAVALSATSARATTRRVPQDYPTIQAAVNAAVTGDVVLVAAGTYGDVTHVPGGGDTTRCAVIMKSGITLQGSGIDVTTINCDSLGRGIYCKHLSNVTIRDLTVKRAYAAVFGSGILVRDTSNVTITTCKFTNNFDGGVIYFNNCNGSLSSCTISNNLSKQGGGVAMEQSCSPRVQNCTITGNAAPVAGGLFIRTGCTPLITDTQVTANTLNTSNGSGAGVTVINASPTFTNVNILNNQGDGIGGGIAIFDGSVVNMNKCVVQGNTAFGTYSPGGGVYADFSSLYMDDCTITRNTVRGLSGDGAGAYFFFANTVVLNQVTIAANANIDQPTMGGGVTCNFASPTISKSIIAFNNPGKAMLCLDQSDNPVVSCTDIYSNAGGNAICGTNAGHNFSLDPLFCDMAHDNYRIAMNSPCYPGRHPDGPTACDRDRIGGQDPGCNPAGTDEEATLGATRLIGNEPNPFHPETTIRYELARAGHVDLRVYDVAGREVRSLVQGVRPAGEYRASWDGRTGAGVTAPSGVYFYRLVVDGVEQTRHMVLAR